MSSSGLGSQFYSISHSGLALFGQEPKTGVVGSITVDLVSAPIAPGEYHLALSTGVGGIEIFLPRYAQFTLDGGSVIGGRDIHDGEKHWKHIKRALHGKVSLPDEIPAYALASHDECPVTLSLLLQTVGGGVDIYRL